MIDERRYLQLAVQRRYVTVDAVKSVCTQAGLDLSLAYDGARHVLLTNRIVTPQQDAALLDELMGEPNDPTLAASGDSMVDSGDSMAEAETVDRRPAAVDIGAETLHRDNSALTRAPVDATLLHVDGDATRRIRRELEGAVADSQSGASAPMSSSTESLPGWASSQLAAVASNPAISPSSVGAGGADVSGQLTRSPSSLSAHTPWSAPPSSVPGMTGGATNGSMVGDEVQTPRTPAQRFQHGGLLGRGGMGEVSLAVDDNLKREVAVKTLLKPEVKVLRERFIAEAQITGQLQHPNIVPVHELGVDDAQRPFLVMKRVRGRSLSDVLRAVEDEERARKASGNDDPSASARALAELLGILEKVCNGVAYAHSRGVIHRDLKPDNIMVGEFGEVLVMDWGLAKVLRTPNAAAAETDNRPSPRSISRSRGRLRPKSSVANAAPKDDGLVNRLVSENNESHDVVAPELHTVDGAIKGTPAYMSPEQAMGDVDRVSERSDTYSLGAILYQMITLKSPVEAGSTARVLVAVANGDLVPPSTRTPDRLVPRELEAVVMKAMALQPRRRYASVLELRDDIVAYLTGRTLGAVEYSPLQRLSKWMRRNRAIGGGAIAVFLVAVAGFIAVAFVQQRAEAEREQERLAEVRTDEDAALAVLDSLRGELEDALVRVKSAPTAATMRLANGELDHAAVDAFYEAHIKALATLEALAQVHETAPTDRVRDAVNVEAIDRQRRELALAVSRAAAELGDYTNARLWIERAVDAGLDPSARADELHSVDGRREQAVNETLAAVEKYLTRARRGQFDEGEFDFALIDLTRRSSPALVRYLLDPTRVESKAELEQRLVITLLGRLGDPVTKGARDRDAVETLVDVLRRTDVNADTEIAYILVIALGQLGDPRAEAAVSAARDNASELFRARTAHAYARIPAAELAVGSMTTALAAADVQFQKGDFNRVVALLSEAMAEWGRDDVDALLMRGTAYYELKRYQEAADDFVRVTELDPDSAVGWGNTGNAYSELDRLDEAIEAQTRSLQLLPDAWTYCNRGSCLQQVGRIEEAIADYTAAIAMDAKLSHAHRFRGVCYLRQREYAKALADINRSLDLEEHWDGYNRRADVYHAMGDYDLAINDATKAIVIAPRQWQPYAARGRAHSARGQYDRAVDDFSSAIGLGSASGYVLLDRADALHHLDRYTESIVDTARILNEFAQTISEWHLGLLYFIRADSLHRIGDSAKAEEAYKLAIKYRPEEANYRFFYGAMLVELDRFQEGLDALDEARRMGEGQPALYFYRGRALDYLGDQDAAIESYTNAIAVAGRHPESSYNRGMLYLERQQYTAAEADFGEAARAPHMRAWALTQRAETRLRQANLDGALLDAQAAVDYAEHNAPDRLYAACVVLGRVHIGLDDPNAAVTALQRAVQIEPHGWMGWGNLADALDRAERYDEARAAYDEALRLAPPEERELLQRNRDAVGGDD